MVAATIERLMSTLLIECCEYEKKKESKGRQVKLYTVPGCYIYITTCSLKAIYHERIWYFEYKHVHDVAEIIQTVAINH